MLYILYNTTILKNFLNIKILPQNKQTQQILTNYFCHILNLQLCKMGQIFLNL